MWEWAGKTLIFCWASKELELKNIPKQRVKKIIVLQFIFIYISIKYSDILFFLIALHIQQFNSQPLFNGLTQLQLGSF
ncbi:hypothetical protein MASR2M47_19300 [Draconibacterium sp.]